MFKAAADCHRIVSYYVYTSDPEEIAEIESLVENGMSYEQAIREMIRRHRA